MTLRWRLALILAALALVVGAVAGGAAWLTTSAQLHSTIDDTLRTRAAALNAEHPDHGDRDDDNVDGDGRAATGCPPAADFQPASAAQIVGTDKTVTSCIAGGVTLPVTAADERLGTTQATLRTVSIGGESVRLISTGWRGGGTLQIARGLEESDHVLSRLRLQLLALVVLIALAGAAVGWLIATRVARPIVRLRDTTERIATTLDFSVPIEGGGADEVGSLATSFATMVEAVRASHEQQRRLVADASHEMRTPLTSLRSNVELLGKIERLPAPERREVIGDVLEEIDELAAMMADLVDLASDLAAAEPAEPVPLAGIAHRVAVRARRRSGRDVRVTETDPAEVVGRPRQLERALGNLVDNAVKYSAVDTPVEVRVDGSTVTVLDRGRGIPVDDLDRVFERFYRAVDARTEPGSGLGLAIVEDVVRGHGGEVFARNREGGGAAIGFTLPPEEDDPARTSPARTRRTDPRD